MKLILLLAMLCTLTACNRLFVRQQPPLIECDKKEVPKTDQVTTKNAPSFIIRLLGYIETDHRCMDEHRKRKDIR